MNPLQMLVFDVVVVTLLLIGYFTTHFFGRNVALTLGGAILGTGVATFILDQLECEIQIATISIRREKEEHCRPKACVGCKNFYGETYNGILLICAIHPYGNDNENCPDWLGN